MTRSIAAGVLGLALAAAAPVLHAQADTARADSLRPFVRGGIYDKPFIGRLAGRIAIGGYAELHARYERVDGLHDESGFVPKRFNLFVNSRVSDVVRFGAELEFEDGAREIALEFAAIDLRLHPAVALRAGIVLTPIGKFNLAHDSPLNEFTDRPLVATELIGSALSEAGVGALGEFGLGRGGRITYEVYATNGLHDGLLLDAPGGTRLPSGRRNFEDNNGSPAVVGRVAWSPSMALELGASAYHGAYNTFAVDGVTVDERRDVAIAALDGEWIVPGLRIAGELAAVRVEIPSTLDGLFAARQRGAYLEVVRDVLKGFQRGLPNSAVAVKLRGDVVDFDADLPGDAIAQWSLGANYRPTQDTAVKFEFVRGRSWDRFNNTSEFAKLLASIATYF